MGHAYIVGDRRKASHLTWWSQGDVLELVGHLVAREEGVKGKCSVS